MAQLGVGQQNAVTEDGRADTRSQGDRHYGSGHVPAGAEPELRQPRGIGIVADGHQGRPKLGLELVRQVITDPG